MSRPEITLQTPDTPESPESFHSAGAGSPLRKNPSNTLHPPNPETDLEPPTAGDELYLIDGQSMQAWNVKRTLMPMMQAQPRTPGLVGPDGNPLSRQNSIISQLSSEILSSENENERGANSRSVSTTGSRRGSVKPDPNIEPSTTGASGADEGKEKKKSKSKRRDSEADDLKCRNCNGTSFRATMADTGQRLRCKKCGTIA
jgi:ribosomal protein S27AE